MKKFISITVCLALLIESIISMVQAAYKNNSIIFSLYILLSLAALLALVFTVFSEFKGYIRLKNTAKINRKIVEFIETSGETVILSRDLSWVNDEIIGKLKQKVNTKKDKLTIFLPAENDVSKELSAFADVRYFGNVIGNRSMERLTSRFTIVHYGTDSVRITYPQEDMHWHKNTEYVQGDAVMTLATDIVKLLDLLTRSDSNVKTT